MSVEDRSFVKEGALFTAFVTGAIAYHNYRQYIKKDFMRSEAHYRFNCKITNMTPWQ
jgi:hypothetical protein